MQVETIKGSKIDKHKWDDLINNSKQGSIYSTFDYINTLCDKEWTSLIVTEGENYLAVFPFTPKKKYFINYFLHPLYAQYWGCIIKDKHFNSHYKYYEYQKKILKSLIEGVPKNLKVFKTYLSPSFDYPLPFIWNNWKLKPCYTYQIDLTPSKEDIIASFASHVRREIKKATSLGIEIIKEKSPTNAINLYRNEKPHLINKNNRFSLVRLQRIVEVLPTENAFCLTAKKEGKVVASIIYYKFKNTLVYFFGTVHSEYKNSGAMSLIIGESILNHSGGCAILDFDGSMVEGIERFFRGFNSKPVMYLMASRQQYLK